MTDRDLTPAEARQEIEAFMGEGWTCHYAPSGYVVTWYARCLPGVEAQGCGQTHRAAVDALKAAWRDAVRPWCLNTMELATDCVVSWESSSGDCWEYQDEFSRKIGAEGIVARVLKEDQ